MSAPQTHRPAMVECNECHGTGEQPLGRHCCGGQGCKSCSQGAPSYAPWDCEACDGKGEVEACPYCEEQGCHCVDGPPDSALDREIARNRREHPEWFDPFD